MYQQGMKSKTVSTQNYIRPVKKGVISPFSKSCFESCQNSGLVTLAGWTGGCLRVVRRRVVEWRCSRMADGVTPGTLQICTTLSCWQLAFRHITCPGSFHTCSQRTRRTSDTTQTAVTSRSSQMIQPSPDSIQRRTNRNTGGGSTIFTLRPVRQKRWSQTSAGKHLRLNQWTSRDLTFRGWEHTSSWAFTSTTDG